MEVYITVLFFERCGVTFSFATFKDSAIKHIFMLALIYKHFNHHSCLGTTFEKLAEIDVRRVREQPTGDCKRTIFDYFLRNKHITYNIGILCNLSLMSEKVYYLIVSD